VLPRIINRCFQVKDAQGKFLQGKDKLNQIAKNLVRKPLKEQPDDFQRLYAIISHRIISSN